MEIEIDQAFEDVVGNLLWFKTNKTKHTGLFIDLNNNIVEEDILTLVRVPNHDYWRVG